MHCPVCRSEEILRPIERSAMEICTCTACGHEFAVHCMYPIPEGSQSQHKLYYGTHKVAIPQDATKSYLKLKKVLAGYQSFELSQLEKQYLEGKQIWELGQFLDIEVEKIKEQCEKFTIFIEFQERTYY